MTTLETILSIGLIIAIIGCIYLFNVIVTQTMTINKLLHNLKEQQEELNRGCDWIKQTVDYLKALKNGNR